MTDILLATNNEGKLVVTQAVLRDLNHSILTMKDVGLQDLDLPEPANTLEGNAIIKAMTVGNMTGKPTIGDDSGIFVDALPNELGVKSKRYAEGTDNDRNQKLLNALVGVPDHDRTARYIAVNVYYNPINHLIHISTGISEGKILTEKRGTGGFGYDPVFYSLDLKKTFAELTEEEIVEVSHRARSLRDMKMFLNSIEC